MTSVCREIAISLRRWAEPTVISNTIWFLRTAISSCKVNRRRRVDAREFCSDTFRVASRQGLRTAVEVSSVGHAASMFAVGAQVLFQGQSAKGFPDCGEALRVYATFLCQSLRFNGRQTLECMRVVAYDALQGARERFGGSSAAMATDWADDCDQCHGFKR